MPILNLTFLCSARNILQVAKIYRIVFMFRRNVLCPCQAIFIKGGIRNCVDSKNAQTVPKERKCNHQHFSYP